MSEDHGDCAVLEGVARSFRRGREEVHALRDVNLCVRRGELLMITGRSGSGKSTLLHLLAGLDRPTAGRILLAAPLAGAGPDGALVDLARRTEEELARLRRRALGFVFQSFHLLPTLSAEENVALPLILDGVDEPAARRRAAELLEFVGLGARAGHLPEELSGGERQRVATARALAPRPALILADEPTGNLDSEQGAQVLALLRALVDRSQATVVLVTHDAGARIHADRVLSLQDGRVEAPDPP